MEVQFNAADAPCLCWCPWGVAATAPPRFGGRVPIGAYPRSPVVAGADTLAAATLLEVVAVNNIAHLGQIRAGLSNAVPLAQGTKIEIVTDESLPMQIDGEPFRQRASLVTLDWACRVKMLLPITTKLPSDPPDASDITDAAWCQNYS